MMTSNHQVEQAEDLGLSQWDRRALSGLPAAVLSSPAQILRYARRWAGLSQRDLAARAQCSQSRVARIEAGRVQPRTDFLERLLALCGLTLRQHVEASGPSERAKQYRRGRQLREIDARLRLQRHRRHEVNLRVDRYARGLESQDLTQRERRELIREEMRRIDAQLRATWVRERDNENRRVRRLVTRDRRRERAALEAAAASYPAPLDGLLQAFAAVHPSGAPSLADAAGRDPWSGRGGAADDTSAAAGDGNATDGNAEECRVRDGNVRAADASELGSRVYLTLAWLVQAGRRRQPRLWNPTPVSDAPLAVVGWLPRRLQCHPADEMGPVAGEPSLSRKGPVLCVATTPSLRRRIVARLRSAGFAPRRMRLPGQGDAVLVDAPDADYLAVAILAHRPGDDSDPHAPYQALPYRRGEPPRYVSLDDDDAVAVLPPAVAGARTVAAMRDEWAARDRAGRHYPAHLGSREPGPRQHGSERAPERTSEAIRRAA